MDAKLQSIVGKFKIEQRAGDARMMAQLASGQWWALRVRLATNTDIRVKLTEEAPATPVFALGFVDATLPISFLVYTRSYKHFCLLVSKVNQPRPKSTTLMVTVYY
jgi:hypothetical protein